MTTNKNRHSKPMVIPFKDYEELRTQRDELLAMCKEMTEKPLHKVNWFKINQRIAEIERESEP